jgi:hypothetical protein
MKHEIKINFIDQKIYELKKIYYYSKKMEGGKRSREIEKEGYSFFKPKLDNIKNDFHYDIKSEISNLITKKEILNHFDNKKEFKDYYEGLRIKGAIEPQLYKEIRPKDEFTIVDSEFNLKNNKNSCKECLDLFGNNMRDLILDFNKSSTVIHNKITEYYNILIKAYTFDYMTDPSINNQHRIQKLSECYNKIINNDCSKKENKIFNYFTLDIKNNLELINNIFN